MTHLKSIDIDVCPLLNTIVDSMDRVDIKLENVKIYLWFDDNDDDDKEKGRLEIIQ
jgi:hypothetical protein